ncbi:MAG: EamA family transporter [Ktedonobacteraceae bacterium]|nr:EamA family transporter [Ktedonobacteraceae bacterium]MBO0791380.1 EamA family transporter [Ktedonobacteraceae bacterium]
MPLAALSIVLGAAVLHAVWNLLLKQAHNKQVFLMWATLTCVICLPSVLFLTPVPEQVWPFIFFSALAEALYFILLTWAYNIGDFSLVYPIARGAAPVLLTLWIALFLKDAPSIFGLGGILLLVIGLVVVGSGAFWQKLSVTRLSFAGIGVALLTAVCISIYSAIDGAAMRVANPLTYTVWIFSLSALMAAPFITLRYGTQLAIAELRANWSRIIVVGLLMLVTYGAVLFAYSLGRVSYTGSIREVSIVFGALMGWRFLGEGFGLIRIIGAVLIFAGIIIIATLG